MSQVGTLLNVPEFGKSSRLSKVIEPGKMTRDRLSQDDDESALATESCGNSLFHTISSSSRSEICGCSVNILMKTLLVSLALGIFPKERQVIFRASLKVLLDIEETDLLVASSLSRCAELRMIEQQCCKRSGPSLRTSYDEDRGPYPPSSYPQRSSGKGVIGWQVFRPQLDRPPYEHGVERNQAQEQGKHAEGQLSLPLLLSFHFSSSHLAPPP
mmetsp:Transcript_11144/g.25256  ORF Transcript_11144/g.25256 Transcript_11144/m.25256 type:complete len:214 (-) Transcript_11144:4-645(-)